MESLSIKSIAEAAGAHYSGKDFAVNDVSTDSRSITEQSLFVALKGDAFDGHAFAADTIKKGAVAAVVSDNVDNVPEEKLLKVKDTRQAYLDIAGLYRSTLPVKVLAITGSVGKTTTKEMTACVCGAKFNTLKTEKNLNNEIGLSQTMLKINNSHEAAVLEMGMDGIGQIAPLSIAAKPDAAIVTNVGVSHLEAMGSRENIRDEKLSITAGMPDGGTIILNGDNDMLADYKNEKLNVVFFAVNRTDCDVTAVNINESVKGIEFEILWRNKKYNVFIPCIGIHNVYNALAAFCAGTALGIAPESAAAALANYAAVGMRQNIVVHNSFTVVEDCYNASPDSMQAAMAAFGKLECTGRRIAVLADMLELGTVAEKSHYEIGEITANSGVDILLCTGEMAKLYVKGAVNAGSENAQHFSTQEELFAELKKTAKPGDTIWVKASNGMKMKNIIERVYAEM